MCLTNCKAEPILNGYKVGKIVHTTEGSYYDKSDIGKFTCFSFNPTTIFDEWVSCIPEFNSENEYHLGFHICPTLKEARLFLKYLHHYDTINKTKSYQDYQIFPCQYTGLLAKGVDESGIDCVVAALINISSKHIE